MSITTYIIQSLVLAEMDTTMKMTKTQYEAIALPFSKETNWTQYLYCTQGFTTVKGQQIHSQRGRDFYDYFKSLDTIVFNIANNLRGINGDKFDRDKFLETAGMQNDGIRGWSFIPTHETIEKVNS